ncbi:LOW QUALITY PROTEIN: hypothetical protein CVT26_006807 [Gymnopilus dilepis]|uniref:Uncharacterized protein n=1 Tax=Gymnopilus dilepis TaxID=231916 RepID=A0A409Y318_9AGAR|nr:LOW QUALITY PROTEIN: hypothetical protein CVT26_006807 [Gymnopilus dilepis]
MKTTNGADRHRCFQNTVKVTSKKIVKYNVFFSDQTPAARHPATGTLWLTSPSFENAVAIRERSNYRLSYRSAFDGAQLFYRGEHGWESVDLETEMKVVHPHYKSLILDVDHLTWRTTRAISSTASKQRRRGATTVNPSFLCIAGNLAPQRLSPHLRVQAMNHSLKTLGWPTHSRVQFTAYFRCEAKPQQRYFRPQPPIPLRPPTPASSSFQFDRIRWSRECHRKEAADLEGFYSGVEFGKRDVSHRIRDPQNGVETFDRAMLSRVDVFDDSGGIGALEQVLDGLGRRPCLWDVSSTKRMCLVDLVEFRPKITLDSRIWKVVLVKYDGIDDVAKVVRVVGITDGRFWSTGDEDEQRNFEVNESRRQYSHDIALNVGPLTFVEPVNDNEARPAFRSAFVAKSFVC